jgi:signal transduction histidine kinase
LRERVGEMGRIVEEVLRGRGIGKRVSLEALEELSLYGWPGNVEELEGLVERTGMLVGGGEILGGGWVWRFRGGGMGRGELRGEELGLEGSKGKERGEVGRGEGEKVGVEGEGVEALLSTLVHEVKNPLVAISTFAHLLPERYEEGEFRVDFSRLVGLEVKRLNGVLDMLMDYGQTGTPCGKSVDLKRRVGALLGEMRSAIEQKRIRIAVKGLEDLPPIRFDERQVKFVLRRVLDSILGREIENREAGIRGRLIKRGIEGGENWVELEVWYDGREGVVKDIPGTEGPGGRYDFESLSLGLGLARRLMMRNGGEMQVHQEEGIGTTIILRFRPEKRDPKEEPLPL